MTSVAMLETDGGILAAEVQKKPMFGEVIFAVDLRHTTKSRTSSTGIWPQALPLNGSK
jgi:hypothetical protein